MEEETRTSGERQVPHTAGGGTQLRERKKPQAAGHLAHSLGTSPPLEREAGTGQGPPESRFWICLGKGPWHSTHSQAGGRRLGSQLAFPRCLGTRDLVLCFCFCHVTEACGQPPRASPQLSRRKTDLSRVTASRQPHRQSRSTVRVTCPCP